MSTEIKLSMTDERLNEIVAAAVLQAMSQESREQLIAQSIRYLITKSGGNSYSAAKSPLEEAFQAGIRQAAYKYVEELFKDPAHPIHEAISKLVEEAYTQVFNGDGREKLKDKIATSIGSAIAGDRY